MSNPEYQRASKTVELSISNSEWELQAQVTVPIEPVQVDELLPLARALSDALVNETQKILQQSGETISCKKGCGACCRQLVAISEIEARQLSLLVDNIPEPRRSLLRSRFAEAQRRLEEAGLLQNLKNAAQLSENDYLSLSSAYFEQHIACPFLEDESCSIYSERPITCREYLVTSPSENCSRPIESNINRVNLPLKVFNAVARWQVLPTNHFLERWVPLVLALEWAESFPSGPLPQPGPELVRELLDHLSGKTTSFEQDIDPTKFTEAGGVV
ncbi:MAG TPA: YkgJ family cysteine cluster protein [Pyrinomonadaceae bacterium]